MGSVTILRMDALRVSVLGLSTRGSARPDAHARDASGLALNKSMYFLGARLALCVGKAIAGPIRDQCEIVVTWRHVHLPAPLQALS